MARRMPKSLPSWLIPRLRRISMWWPGKSIAREQAKVKVEIGKSKKGKAMFRVFYKCAKCGNFVKKDEGAMDHIDPIVNVAGFKDWNELIAKLFCPPEGYQHLCHKCHGKKTESENKERTTIKRLTKKKK